MQRNRLASLVLCFVTLAVFSRVLTADFVQWDDDISVYQNPHVQGLDRERLRWMFTDAGYAMRYKPLTWLSYALVHQVGGLNPFGYHLLNLMLHCGNAVLVFAVIRQLLATRGVRTGGAARETTLLPAALGAAFWALHPLRVEPVARVTDLTYGLSLFFLLISLWLYLRAGCGDGAGRRWTSLGGSVMAYALAMLSYPFAAGWGIVLLVLDWYPLRRFETCPGGWRSPAARRIVLEKIPYLVLGGLVFTTFLARMHPTGQWSGIETGKGLLVVPQTMQAFYIWAYYVWKPWVPFHLSPVYTTLVDFHPGDWPFWVSATLVAGISALVLWKRRQHPWALALWACHLVLLLPALGLTERPHYPSDRYGHIPGLVWAVAAAAALAQLSRRPRMFQAGMAAAGVLVALLGGLSFHQTRIWRDTDALFRHMIVELGNDPYRAEIHWRLGWFHRALGNDAEALRQYQAALRIRSLPQFHEACAGMFEKSGDTEAALTNYLAVLRSRASPDLHNNVGTLLSRGGDTGAAIAHYREALRLAPDLVSALNNLAWELATDARAAHRNGTEAVQLAGRARDLTKGESFIVLGTLAAAYAEAGRFEEAVATVEQAQQQALAAGEVRWSGHFQELQNLFRSGRPCRRPLRPAPENIPGQSRPSGQAPPP